MLLCKAKMQGLDIKTAELKKLRPISQGTQMTEEQLDKDPDNVSQLNILPLPETEEDKAVKDLLQSEGLAIIESSVTTMSNVINTTASNVATTSNAAISGFTTLLNISTGQGVPAALGRSTIMSSNVTTPQYAVITLSNVESVNL